MQTTNHVSKSKSQMPHTPLDPNKKIYREMASMPFLRADIQLFDVISDSRLNSFDAAVRNRLYNCQTKPSGRK